MFRMLIINSVYGTDDSSYEPHRVVMKNCFVSRILVPIFLLNLLITLNYDGYELIQVKSVKELYFLEWRLSFGRIYRSSESIFWSKKGFLSDQTHYQH